MVANGIARRRGIIVILLSALLVATVGVGVARAMLSTTPMTIQPQLNAGGYIKDIEVSGNTAYIGGSFTTVGGQSRSNLASFNLNTGAVSSWNPGANAAVTTLDVSGSDIYVGGSFTTIGTNSAKRSYAAKIDSAGAATSWNPGMSAAVNAIDVRNSVAYLGGSFTSVGSCVSRGAALSPTDGTSCDLGLPDISNGGINAVARDGSGGWYIGGTFTTVGGLTRNRVAHILSNGSVDTSWNPNADSTVTSLAVYGSTVYVGGDFGSIGGSSRAYIAALDSSGTATSWNPSADASVRDVEVSSDGSTIYASGGFTSIGGDGTIGYLAGLNNTNGNVTGWDPQGTWWINEIELSPDGSTLYAGGGFNQLGGSSRSYIGAVDTSTGLATTWAPSGTNQWINALEVSPNGAAIYVGGDFTTIGGQSRSRIAKLNATDGAADLAWDPSANSSPRSIAVSSDNQTVYVGGSFTTIASQSRNFLAALDATSGNANSWDPNPSGGGSWSTALAFSSDGNTLYVGSDFTSVAGQTRNRTAAVDNSGSVTSWNPNADNTVNELKFSSDGQTLYAGGVFTSIGGSSRNRIAALNTSGTATSWNPNADNTVNTLAFSSDGNTVFTGGTFSSIGGQTRNKLAAIDTSTGNATSWDPDLDNTVNALAVTSSNEVFAAGSFDAVGELVRPKLAKIGTDGNATSWTPTPNQAPSSLAMWGNNLIVGAGSSAFSIFRYGYSDAVVRKGLGVFNDVSVPSNTQRPWISGAALPKQSLTCNRGTWSSDVSVTYNYEWKRGGGQVVGGNRSTYVVTSDDVGEKLYCSVIGTNFAGSLEADSSQVTISNSAASEGTTTESASCKTRGKIVSKSLSRALRRGKIRVKVTTNKTGSTANLHLRAYGIRSKLAARQRVTFSKGLTTKRVTLKLRSRAKRELRRRVNKRMKRGQKKVAMRLRVYCFDGGKKTRTSTSQKMSLSKKKARSKKNSRSKSR